MVKGLHFPILQFYGSSPPPWQHGKNLKNETWTKEPQTKWQGIDLFWNQTHSHEVANECPFLHLK